MKKIKKKLNNPNILIIIFLISPTTLSLILSLIAINSDSTQKNGWVSDFFSDFMYFSGYFFTLSSLLLVFILYRKYAPSEHMKNLIRLNHIENKGEEKFLKALEKIYENIISNDFNNNVSEACTTIKVISKNINELESDTYLKSLKIEIEDIVSLLNEFKVESKGLHNFQNNENASEKLMLLKENLYSVIEDIRNKRDYKS